MPPSLNLPDPVSDLAAVRTGNEVLLTWKMPKKSTDKLLLKGLIPVHVCRKEGSGPCVPVPGNLVFHLKRQVASRRHCRRRLQPVNRVRSVILWSCSTATAVPLAFRMPPWCWQGEAPPAVANLSAKVIKAGVVLRWTPEHPGEAIRLHRKLLTPKAEGKPQKAQQGPLAPTPELEQRNLLVDAGSQAGTAPDRALDQDIRFGQVYEYRAQRIARVTADGQTLELAGPFSEPVRVEANDIFPPMYPPGLAAVATLAAGWS
jgi:hypothetical protein